MDGSNRHSPIPITDKEDRPDDQNERQLPYPTNTGTVADSDGPCVKGEGDLLVLTSQDRNTGATHNRWYHFNTTDMAYTGMSTKVRYDITLDEFKAGLERIVDEAIFPELPADVQRLMASTRPPSISSAPVSSSGPSSYLEGASYATNYFRRPLLWSASARAAGAPIRTSFNTTAAAFTAAHHRRCARECWRTDPRLNCLLRTRPLHL